ncbi:response regulator [Actinokineospora globicatena]|uniref:DNA-binding response regulator n=1 Tax=Actinokineospora globicatena TaxID=103729 RepID=A0A9W6VC18_9PSEU|nr:response regulator transcription factor [Actinokineospora globicatena]MCP2305576.1 two component transcriptional regulator, LuxR family [Actinokineospora globicatena]GLW81446.1 DNA-binding response regulator [Actinokineospora globicatena]GLW87856.1 DNA-binding response regulator [Actinokineospora globicatena]GLW94534.1 DNA-binding response regulator [Actinokineospora globicatena]
MTDLLLCDDHTVFADALSTVLTQHGFTVRGVAATVAGAVAALRGLKPDLCLLDRTLADGDGVAALGELIKASPHTKILVLTADENPDTVTRALEAGAAGYLHKTGSVTALAQALRRALNGEVVVELPNRVGRTQSSEVGDAHRLAAHLTPRERQCLALLVEGASTVAMQRRMGISSTTVRTHIQALLTKLGVHSRLEAASFAVRNRLLVDPPHRATGT